MSLSEASFLYHDQVEFHVLLAGVRLINSALNDTEGHVTCQRARTCTAYPPGGKQHRCLTLRNSQD